MGRARQGCAGEGRHGPSNTKEGNPRRRGHYFGMAVDDPDDPSTSLWFADDVLLIGQSCSDIRKMIVHVRLAAAEHGLKPNTRKNQDNYTETIEVRDGEGFQRYLGHKLCFG